MIFPQCLLKAQLLIKELLYAKAAFLNFLCVVCDKELVTDFDILMSPFKLNLILHMENLCLQI